MKKLRLKEVEFKEGVAYATSYSYWLTVRTQLWNYSQTTEPVLLTTQLCDPGQQAKVSQFPHLHNTDNK